MVTNQIEVRTDMDSDNSTVCTTKTPTKSVADDIDDLFNAVSPNTPSVPWPGSTFIIRSVSCGRVVTLLGGQVVLAQRNDRNSIYWTCTETQGWLGFRNHASGKFLGHDAKGKLICEAELHRWWERFNARQRREGGYVLLMIHEKDVLRHVGTKSEQGLEKLAKLGEGGSGGIAWEFIEVDMTAPQE